MTEVRPATRDDAWLLAELRWDFRAGKDQPVEDRGAFLARCAAWMRRELAQQSPWRAFVAVRDGRIIGQLWLHTMQKVPNPIGERERHAYLSNLYVQPSERGGVGTQLLDAALAWARDNGVDRVVLWPTSRSESLYRRYGFKRDGDVLELTC